MEGARLVLCFVGSFNIKEYVIWMYAYLIKVILFKLRRKTMKEIGKSINNKSKLEKIWNKKAVSRW